MTDQEYVLCTWKKRLWPAKVLCKTGAGGKTSIKNAKETSFKVEILGLKKQISVSRADAVPLKEECIENIASSLDQRNNSSEAVEELRYRCSLKIALDILNQNISPREVPPSERLKSQLSRENDAGSLSSTPLRRCRLFCHSKEESVPETSKKKREQKNASLKTDAKPQTRDTSFLLEEGAKAHEKGTNTTTCNTSHSDNQNCKTPDSKPLPGQKKMKPALLTKSQTGNKDPLTPKEEKSEQGRKSRRDAVSPLSRMNRFPGDAAQPRAEEGSPLPVPCEGVPLKRANTRSQPRRTLLASSCKSASDDLEKSISSESESLAKQLGGRRQPAGLKRVNGEQETLSSCRKRRCRNGPESSSGPSICELRSESVPSQREEQENKNISHPVTDKVTAFQLPDFEEDEGLESSDLSPKIVYPESLSRLSALVDEEEDEDEELPSILSNQEPQSIEEGMLVWYKLRRYPHWPAVVKKVKRKRRKACVLFIEGSTNDKKKGFSVSLRSLKHFDCEEKQDLIERAKEDYRQEIEWCIRLISDYRIRVGCRSFTGSFLEYFAADISYPVRKECCQGLVPMSFPNVAEENIEESSSETSPQKPSKKLLPDRTRAARDKANKKIVEFIVKTKGAEEHLLAILKSRKQSRWLKEFLNSSQYVTCVETYLEDEEQLDLVVNYLKEVYCEMGAKNLQQINGDAIKFISDVLLPEAIIYAISAVDDIDYKKAEEKYIKGPSVSKREREIFDEEILERKKGKRSPAWADSA
ncbi:PREDICTED: PWWP domain-containing protein MUM1 isoform X2 [Calidris pugnax]|uniref:PWWP domain-containing protein MUM1 isoform X1 n=1 Tax=Calidris pugnax TaxID=198806 RepID=UPI00071D646B|nr:PREDICTED: PWWP domain-containing protein MUM1 isoform X1 [Calidris pugnax]XP_014811063.1 PREDICTED: PWWP domain-containing protein MUM1 isoform X2 [Calidris pugnax]XP_014811064.1 PREDICTED: PWWP domain-containing protein MUM1 isoform X2 [Calidris pugnax]